MTSLVTETLRAGYAGNLTTLRRLQLLGGWTNEEAARRCLVSPETFRRWRSDRRPNPTAVRLLAIEAGYLPWPNWRGWEIHSGLLFPPGLIRGGLSPSQVEGLPWALSLMRHMVRERSTISRGAPAVLDLPAHREAS